MGRADSGVRVLFPPNTRHRIWLGRPRRSPDRNLVRITSGASLIPGRVRRPGHTPTQQVGDSHQCALRRSESRRHMHQRGYPMLTIAPEPAQQLAFDFDVPHEPSPPTQEPAPLNSPRVASAGKRASIPTTSPRTCEQRDGQSTRSSSSSAHRDTPRQGANLRRFGCFAVVRYGVHYGRGRGRFSPRHPQHGLISQPIELQSPGPSQDGPGLNYWSRLHPTPRVPCVLKAR